MNSLEEKICQKLVQNKWGPAVIAKGQLISKQNCRAKILSWGRFYQFLGEVIWLENFVS